MNCLDFQVAIAGANAIDCFLKFKSNGKLDSLRCELIEIADILIAKIIIKKAVANLRKNVAGQIAT